MPINTVERYDSYMKKQHCGSCDRCDLWVPSTVIT